ncbi:hypothetical protein [Bradyrhizobium sp. SZCCHNR1045]|uniref:hypothetical protein n=1 Tax=Bradyrhizobium sp. SZCCHNR1045 TaxID=3057353 RepID=UPI0029169DD5|nr:hypothetical protein [Bradyrhizobium sp. SZCCHNR1045]
MKHLAVLSAALAALIGSARAQDARTFSPYAYAPTVGTTPAQVAPANPLRKKIIFFNPNASAKVAICLPTTRGGGAQIACAIGGSGSVTLLPYGSFELDAGAVGNGAMTMGSAWNGVADTPSSALTVIEME